MDRKWLVAVASIAIVLGAGGLAAAVVGAAGKGKIKVTTQSRDVIVVPERGVTVRTRDCRGRSINSGTGFDLGTYDPTGVGPQGRVTGVLEGVLGTVNTGGAPQEARAERYCASGFRGERRPRAETQLVPGESGKATRSCDRGFEAVQAGFEVRDKDDSSDEGGSELRVRSLFLSQLGTRRRAVVEATNASADREFRLSIYVSCVRRGPKISVRKATAEVPSEGEILLSAQCRRRKQAIGGGFKGSPGTYVVSALKEGRRAFFVRAVRDVPGTGQLTAFVHCVGR